MVRIFLFYFLLVAPPVVSQTMILVPGGSYMMGDVLGDSLYPDERPLRAVMIDSFFLAATETTFAEYDRFCRATGHAMPSDNGWGRGEQPVFHVDWYDAAEYCNWLSAQENLPPYYIIVKNERDPANRNAEDTKHWKVTRRPTAKGYRLPFEAEWEYSARAILLADGTARGGGNLRFANGRNIATPDAINFRADAVFKKAFSETGIFREKTLPVRSLNPNALGLYQMSGNVFEWCDDWYFERAYDVEVSDQQTPTGPASGSSKVARGGSWYSQAAFCRTSYRFEWPANIRCAILGFRVARNK
jgi:formylglycine-generating enzyme